MTLVARPGSLYTGFVEASRKDWLGGRQFDVDRYLHGATLEETVATGVYCLVTGKRRDSNVYFVQSGGTNDPEKRCYIVEASAVPATMQHGG